MSDGYASQEDFHLELDAQKAEAAGGNDSLWLGSMLERLMRTDGAWSEEAFVGLVRGDHGEVIQENVLCEMGFGFRVGKATVSFVTLAVTLGRLPVLRAVAELGMPEILARRSAGAPYGMATTPTGVWLDRLSSTLESPPRSPNAEGPSTIVYRVDALSDTEAAHELADLVIRHDPGHRGIEVIKGRPGHALLMAALMRRHVDDSAATAEPSAGAAATPRRHRRQAL
jgi:hypothetical protein